MAQCRITLERVRPVQEWTNDQFTDWLHPFHGPLPNDVVRASSGTDHYVVAVWIDNDYIQTVLECPRKPVGRGSILWSAKWARDAKSNCVVNVKTNQAVTKPTDWYRNRIEFYQVFIPAVIEEAETSPLGSVSQGRRQIIKNGAWLRKAT